MNIQEILAATLATIQPEPQQKSSVEVFINSKRTTEEQRISNKKLYKEYVESKEYRNAFSNNLINAVNYLQFEEEILEVDGVFKDKGYFIIEQEGEE